MYIKADDVCVTFPVFDAHQRSFKKTVFKAAAPGTPAPGREDRRSGTASCRIDICVIPETMHAAIGPTDGIDSLPSTPI